MENPQPITPDSGAHEPNDTPYPTAAGLLSQDPNDQNSSIPLNDVLIEDILGTLPIAASTPTAIPKRFRDGFALDSRFGRIWYYVNNAWKFVGINGNSVVSITSSATPAINTDVYNRVSITALATNITSFTTSLTGTPSNFDTLIIRIKDDGTARTLAWGASFAAKGVALPTTTVISKLLTVGFIYDSVAASWGCVASVQET